MEKNTLKRIDNFILYERSSDGYGYVGITTVGGDWSMEYREDCTMYSTVMQLAEHESGLRSFCTLMFIMSYTMHSAEVYLAMADAISGEVLGAGLPKVDEEQDRKMLDDAFEMEELAENITVNG